MTNRDTPIANPDQADAERDKQIASLTARVDELNKRISIFSADLSLT